jgi:hypothetical protein
MLGHCQVERPDKKGSAAGSRRQVQAEQRLCPCYDTMLIFLEYEILALGRRSMNVDVAVMLRYRSYPRY